MTEQEAIEQLRAFFQYDLTNEEDTSIEMAIKALEKQIKLKECIEKLKTEEFGCFVTDRKGTIELLSVFLLDWE